MTVASLALVLGLCAAPAPVPADGYLYRTTLVQAAPGKLLDVIELYKAGWPGVRDSGDEPPITMRHSQGDRWDLLVLFPMGSYGEYYAPDRIARRAKARDAGKAQLARLSDDVAWQEDVFVYGPPLSEVRGAFAKAGFFHVEMFIELPGKGPELYRQREMENAYSARLNLPQNLIFVRDAGAPWDLFTIGAYRDLKHYAENADVPEAKSEDAARTAGFDGAKAIGPYLRTLIREHHDTLAVAVR
ncbi:MAG TPA: hypothetical protein VN032_03760 [Thermoanaerobaculia bacterium]|nr:hypothetical protein [Thermoanaerobaculia bacterium]